MGTKKLILPEGWEIDKVEGNEIILKESKKELPKTWEECMRISEREAQNNKDYDGRMEVTFYNEGDYKKMKYFFLIKGYAIEFFLQLLACRKVYRQGWVPDWQDEEMEKHCILVEKGIVTIAIATHTSHVLSFQSEEVRDQFLENFRDLIEEAKELI